VFLANDLSGCCASQRSFGDYFVAVDAERPLDLIRHAFALTEDADRNLRVRVPVFSHRRFHYSIQTNHCIGGIGPAVELSRSIYSLDGSLR
jgi:hypothetical protein